MQPATTRESYHHGNLRATLIDTAMEMLEDGEAFSLRAVARRAGVSQTAPYRHFADREALESALAVQGFRDLKQSLIEVHGLPTTPDQVADLAVAYVDFALRRPALFKLMFGNACDPTDAERVRASDELHELVAAALTSVFPDADPALATAGWGLAHGLAFLHLDGKLAADDIAQVHDRVRSAFSAVFANRA